MNDTPATHTETVQQQLTSRLRRIEGQMRGVQRMLDEGRDCREVIQQLNAARAALDNALALYTSAYVKDCLMQADDDQSTADATRAAMIDDVISLLARTG